MSEPEFPSPWNARDWKKPHPAKDDRQIFRGDPSNIPPPSAKKGGKKKGSASVEKAPALLELQIPPSETLAAVEVPASALDNNEKPCEFAISQSGFGHIMYSAATAQSTMDFSMMPVDDGVVDSPQNGGKCLHPVSSPSPLKGRPLITSPHNSPAMNVGTQRKLYDEQKCVVPAHKATDTLAETNAIRSNSSRQAIPSRCNYQERPTTSNGLWRILPRRTLLEVADTNASPMTEIQFEFI